MLILLLGNYKTYSINIPSDTIVSVSFRGVKGAFLDSAKLAKTTKKVILADSLEKLNQQQDVIIKRQSEQIQNCKVIVQDFYVYRDNSKKQIILLEDTFNVKQKKTKLVLGSVIITQTIIIVKLLFF